MRNVRPFSLVQGRIYDGGSDTKTGATAAATKM